jgi:hypothetical protein
MAIKIETKQTAKKPKEIVYPCFKKSNNGNELIVLFFEEAKGIVVDQGTAEQKVGYYFEIWIDFSEVPLENYSATISSEP